MSTITLERKAVHTRISSIDVMRGLVMVVMALDHTRDFLHTNALFYNPIDLNTTTPFLFFTRWITHYCAPIFVFLAGTSAYLSGKKKTTQQLSMFLLTRGFWLVVLELTVLNFAFWFDITFSTFQLQVMWAIGVSMMVLGALVFLPKQVILWMGLCMVIGHNMLDYITFPEDTALSRVWSLLHQADSIPLTPHLHLLILYPLIPWIGVMALGYCFGELYSHTYDQVQRKKDMLQIGILITGGFIVLRSINIYGDPSPWAVQDSVLFTVMSFLNVTKYPPSLLYLLMTLGPAMLGLYWMETLRAKWVNFFTVYGQVPLFYYLLHFYILHLIAVVSLLVAGISWSDIDFQNGTGGIPKGQGVSLGMAYLIWLLVVLGFYPACKWYNQFKSQRKSKVWSYL